MLTGGHQIEKQFAVKGMSPITFSKTLVHVPPFPNRAVAAVKHLETYWAILEKVKGSTLRLTKIDDDIYDHLAKDFPDFDPAKTIIEDEMKSPEGKKRWREFMMVYENKVDDFSFGTILRTDPKDEYTQHGSIFGECGTAAGMLLRHFFSTARAL